MASVPKQVEDLVRIIARAFYTDLYIVVLDALVREKYIRQDLLSKKLHIPTKELRKLLLKLQEQKLVKCEVRVQRKPAKNNTTEYQRAIKATFWYIDYVNLVDIIKYRVDGMRQKVMERMAEGHIYQSFQCQKCKEVYSSLDSARLFVPTEGVLRCDNVILRNTLCNGLVEEVELEGQMHTVKELQTRMENELRPILEMVAKAEQETVPVHPLEGLDADQLGTIISEDPNEQPTWDMLREEFYEKQTAQPQPEEKKQEPNASQIKVEIVATGEEGTSYSKEPLEVKQHVPSWFEENKADTVKKEQENEQENNWIVELEDSQLQKTDPLSEQLPVEDYSLAYYRSLMEASQTASQAKEKDSELSQEPDVLFEETLKDTFLDQERDLSTSNVLMQDGKVMVKVQGQLVALKDVKETHLKQMTTEEYLAYYETLMQTQIG